MKRLFSYLYNTSAMAFSVAVVLLIIALVWGMRKFDEGASWLKNTISKALRAL